MDVKMGSPVVGTNGKLGEVHRVIVDARTNKVTDLVVKHGFVFSNERMVPLSCVDRVEDDGTVHVRLDEKGFEAMNGFADERFHAPDPDFVAPPGFDNNLFLVDTIWSTGGGSGFVTGTKPFGFPGGEQISPDDMQRPTVSAGTDVADVEGEKVGEVEALEWDADGGAPTRLVLRRGHIFHTETELPVDWIENIGEEGVMLKVKREQVEALAEQAEKRAGASG